MKNKARKVGQNKGKARIWLEGNELLNAGIKHGMRFNVAPVSNGLLITIESDGKRKIAGNPARPIVDMTGSTVESAGFNIGDLFELQPMFKNGLLIARL